MSTLLQLAQAAKKAAATASQAEVLARGHSILLYGPPKSGKTRLAATSAMADNIDRVFFFDNENGSETLLSMLNEGALTEEAAAKIILINIDDTKADPYAIETMLRVLNSIKAPVYVRYDNGKLQPKKPTPFDESIYLEFQLSKLTRRDVVIVDSGSQLGDSALAALMLGRSSTTKPEWDDYSAQGTQLGDCLSVMQQARYCNFIMVTHDILLKDQDGNEKFFPMCGTRAFCHKVAKYFGTVAHVKVKLKKHVAGSSSGYSSQALTGSRRALKLEDMKVPSLAPIFDFAVADVPQATEEQEPMGSGTGGALDRLKKK